MRAAMELGAVSKLLYKKTGQFNLYISRRNQLAMDLERLSTELRAIQSLVSELEAGLNCLHGQREQ